MRKLKDRIIIWPVYLDATKTTREGRRLPKRIALYSPTVQEVFDATKLLKLDPELRRDACHPRSWWTKSGYVIANRIGSKRETLRTLARKIGWLRTQREN